METWLIIKFFFGLIILFLLGRLLGSLFGLDKLIEGKDEERLHKVVN